MRGLHKLTRLSLTREVAFCVSKKTEGENGGSDDLRDDTCGLFVKTALVVLSTKFSLRFILFNGIVGDAKQFNHSTEFYAFLLMVKMQTLLLHTTLLGEELLGGMSRAFFGARLCRALFCWRQGV